MLYTILTLGIELFIFFGYIVFDYLWNLFRSIQFMKKVLVLFAHPAFHKSFINRALINGIRNMDGILVRELYELYPDFFIDVEAEQKLLLEHDIIVWHHPFYWYSAPAILKEWMDLVLQHGFAYGQHGKALEGKWIMSCVSTGGRKEVYSQTGSNHFTINEFLVPFRQSAILCSMHYLPPFVIHGSHVMTEDKLEKHVTAYHDVLKLLRDDKIQLQELEKLEYLNDLIKEHA